MTDASDPNRHDQRHPNGPQPHDPWTGPGQGAPAHPSQTPAPQSQPTAHPLPGMAPYAAPPTMMVTLKPTAVTVMLIIEAAITVLLLLVTVALFVTTASAGNPPPASFLTFFTVTLVASMLRVGSLGLVRIGMGWARWVYIAVAALGQILAASIAAVPITTILLILAIVTVVMLFRRPTREWLRWRAEQRAASAAHA